MKVVVDCDFNQWDNYYPFNLLFPCSVPGLHSQDKEDVAYALEELSA